MSTLERARLAFDWVVRQVTLKERARQVRYNTQDDMLRPPQFVLQLGSGTAQERTLVFLALLQQLGIDCCMIACPGEKGQKKFSKILHYLCLSEGD